MSAHLSDRTAPDAAAGGVMREDSPTRTDRPTHREPPVHAAPPA